MNLIRVIVAGCFLLAYVFFKVDKETFGNLEWIALGIFILVFFITMLVASISDDLNKDE